MCNVAMDASNITTTRPEHRLMFLLPGQITDLIILPNIINARRYSHHPDLIRGTASDEIKKYKTSSHRNQQKPLHISEGRQTVMDCKNPASNWNGIPSDHYNRQ